MKEDIKDMSSVIVISLLMVALVCVVSFGLISVIESWQCSGYAAMNPDLKFHFDATTGCWVQHDGVWIPCKYLRGVP